MKTDIAHSLHPPEPFQGGEHIQGFPKLHEKGFLDMSLHHAAVNSRLLHISKGRMNRSHGSLVSHLYNSLQTFNGFYTLSPPRLNKDSQNPQKRGPIVGPLSENGPKALSSTPPPRCSTSSCTLEPPSSRTKACPRKRVTLFMRTPSQKPPPRCWPTLNVYPR